MQPSTYLKTYPFDERPGSLLVYSTKKTSLTVLGEEFFRSIGDRQLSEEEISTLSRLGIVVPDATEERRSMLGYVNALNAGNRNLNLSVFLNMDCNFRCVYCYEEGFKGRLYMSDETADLLMDFIKERYTEAKKTLTLDFYGGEPLLSIGLIKYISAAAKKFVEGRGGEYSFTLVTNGSLFTGKVAEELRELGLKAVKVTLDGPADNHNRYRPFRTGAGSFDTIIRNIRETCDIVKIGIGGNFDRESHPRFVQLLDYLGDEGLTPERIWEVKFSPVMNRPAGDVSPADYADGCMSINEPWLLEADTRLREEILRRGYRTSRFMPMPCHVEITDAYVVNYDGLIYKCPTFIGRKEFAIGSLRDGIVDYSGIYRLDIWKNEECLGCAYLPLCFGGCRFMAFLRDGSLDRIDCKRPYMDAVLERLLRQDMKYRPAVRRT